MKNWKVWLLTDEFGNELAKGRKKDVLAVAYGRYVYEGIYTDNIFRTDENLF